MSYYQHHVFVCCNQRDADAERPCCAGRDSQALRDYAKQRIKALGLNGAGRVRINQSGCLDRCEEGPVMVVYPEETWYCYLDEEDVDEIIESHLKNNKPVERLRI